MDQNTDKTKRSLFKKHFERVLRRIEKRYENDKNYSDFRRPWPITGWVGSESGDSIAIGFGYGGFLVIFQYEEPSRTFKATAQTDIRVPLKRTRFDDLVAPDKTVLEFELEITEPAESPKPPVLRFRQGVSRGCTVGPDETRLFGELVRDFVTYESCGNVHLNFEVLVEYVARQTALCQILKIAEDSLDKQFEEIKIAWPGVIGQ